MKCQILFSGKSKKNSINLLSTEFPQRVQMIKLRVTNYYLNPADPEMKLEFYYNDNNILAY